MKFAAKVQPFIDIRKVLVGPFSYKYKDNKSADLAVDYSPIEVLALPLKSNKQQETYADMTTPH
jgi:hypothetical protein